MKRTASLSTPLTNLKDLLKCTKKLMQCSLHISLLRNNIHGSCFLTLPNLVENSTSRGTTLSLQSKNLIASSTELKSLMQGNLTIQRITNEGKSVCLNAWEYVKLRTTLILWHAWLRKRHSIVTTSRLTLKKTPKTISLRNKEINST